MTLATTYPWLKALHVASVMLLIAAALSQALFLASPRVAGSADLARWFHRAERRLSLPAIALALASGLALASTARWVAAPWLIAKLALVFVLLGIHGFQSGQLRRLAAGQIASGRAMQGALIAIVTVIAVLAVVKPGFA